MLDRVSRRVELSVGGVEMDCVDASGVDASGNVASIAVAKFRNSRAKAEQSIVLKSEPITTEQEWLAAKEPDDLLEFLRARASDRRFRLFMAACCRRFLSLVPKAPGKDRQLCEKAVDIAERFADGLISKAKMNGAFEATDWVYVSSDGSLASAAVRRLVYPDIAGSPLPMLRGSNPITHPASEVAAYSRRVVSRLQPQSTASAGRTPTAKMRLATIAEKRYQIGLLHDIFGNPLRPLPPERGKAAWLKHWRRYLAWNDANVANLARSIYDNRQFHRLPALADALEEAGCEDATIIGHCRGPGPHVRGCWVLDLVLGKR